MEKYISNIVTPKISIAPMVDKSHRHFRYFCRIMNKEALLYTEMVTAQAIINGDLDRILYFREEEGPVALQIAASNSEDAFKAVKIAEKYNYSEINLNCGCPSDRVSGNLMGAALMSDKDLVYEILLAMKEATNKPITIKHRIGIDGTGVIENNKIIMNGYEDLLEFLDTVSKAKPDRYTVHARSAILKGLSPKDNREVPPLDYNMVYNLKKDFKYLNIEINGGFRTLTSIKDALEKVDGVMIGRAAYEDCYLLANLHKIDKENKNIEPLSRGEIIKSYIPYVDEELEKGSNVHSLAAPLQSLFQGQQGSRKFKQLLSSSNIKNETLVDLLNNILEVMPQDILWRNS